VFKSSLSHSRSGGRGEVTALIRSRKSQRHQGSALNFPPGQTSLRTWSWAGHCSTRCSAISSAPLQCGHWTSGGVPASDPVKISCQQRRVTSTYLGHHQALVPGPVTLSALELLDTAGEHPMDSGMWVAEIFVASNALLVPFDSRKSWTEGCSNVVPLLASRSASMLPSRLTCPGIHWTLTKFDKPMVARTVQMELHVVSVCWAGPWARKADSPVWCPRALGWVQMAPVMFQKIFSEQLSHLPPKDHGRRTPTPTLLG